MAERGNSQGRILCLDGGGVRGVSSLWILKEIMDEVAALVAPEDPFADDVGKVRPCDYFDIIGGTSTGGLIALMLGRMGYTVDEAIAKYKDLSKEIFTAKFSDPTAKYDHGILESCLKKVITECPLELEENALLEAENRAFLMRTYQRKEASEPSPFQGKIWEAARATSAAPTFFNPIIINGSSYSDGGTVANNPAEHGVFEGWALWGPSKMKCLVSLGTGLEAPLVLPGSVLRHLGPYWTSFLKKVLPRWLFHRLEISMFSINCLTSSARTHHQVEQGSKSYGAKDFYHRLNVSDERMAKISLDAWDKTDAIIEYAKGYMSRPENVEVKKAIAKLLVRKDDSEPEGTIGPHVSFQEKLQIRVHLQGHNIEGLPVDCVIDPRCGFSSISTRLIRRWNITTTPLPANLRIKKTRTNALDFVTLIFSFEDSSELYRHLFSIYKDDSQGHGEIQLGQDFLMLHQEILLRPRPDRPNPQVNSPRRVSRKSAPAGHTGIE